MNKILLMLVMVFGLTACMPDILIRHEVIEKKNIVVPELDESLLEPCRETQPPVSSMYIQANRDVKEALLTEYIASLLIDNKKCSLDKATLKAMLDKQKANIKQFNLEEETRVKALTEKKDEK